MNIFLHFDPIFELNTGDDFGDQLGTTQFQPPLLRTFAEFEHHRQNACSRSAAAGLGGAQSHAGKSRFNRVAGTNVMPMLGRKVIEAQQRDLVFDQALGRLRILGLVALHEVIEGGVRPFSRRGHPDLVQVGLCLGLQMLG